MLTRSAPGRKAVVLLARRGGQPRFPVPWLVARPTDGGLDWERREAAPVDEGDPCSPWLATRPEETRLLRRAVGRSDYTAHAGAYSGGANAVYWLDVLSTDGNTVTARNRIEGAKKKVQPVHRPTGSRSRLPPSTRRRGERVAGGSRRGDPPSPGSGAPLRGSTYARCARHYPLALSYLSGFEDILRSRAAYTRYFHPTDPFWSVFDVGTYTFSPWKVVWPGMGRALAAAVIGPVHGRPVVPQHTVTMVATASEREAHYLCGVLNSGLPARILAALSPTGSKGHGSAAVLSRIAIPAYQPSDNIHNEISYYSHKAHLLISQNEGKKVNLVSRELANLARSLL